MAIPMLQAHQIDMVKSDGDITDAAIHHAIYPIQKAPTLSTPTIRHVKRLTSPVNAHRIALTPQLTDTYTAKPLRPTSRLLGRITNVGYSIWASPSGNSRFTHCDVKILFQSLRKNQPPPNEIELYHSFGSSFKRVSNRVFLHRISPPVSRGQSKSLKDMKRGRGKTLKHSRTHFPKGQQKGLPLYCYTTQDSAEVMLRVWERRTSSLVGSDSLSLKPEVLSTYHAMRKFRKNWRGVKVNRSGLLHNTASRSLLKVFSNGL